MTAAEPAFAAWILADPRRSSAAQVHAIVGLGLAGGPGGRPLLAAALARANDPLVRCAAILAIGLSGGDEWTGLLEAELRDREGPAPLRAAATTALARIGLVGFGHPRTVGRLHALAHRDGSPLVRAAALSGLAQARTAGAHRSACTAAQLDPDPGVAGLALVCAAEIAAAAGRPDRETRDLATQALGEEAEERRGFAAIALGLLAPVDPAAASVLRATLATDPAPTVSAACAVGLGLAGDPEALPLLTAQVAQPTGHAVLREFACVALGLLGQGRPGATQSLIHQLQCCNVPGVKAAAALALGSVGPSLDTAALLREHLQDRNRYFQRSAILAIGRARDPRLLDALWHGYQRETNPETRALCVVAMGCIADRSPLPVLRRIASGFAPEAVGAALPAIARVLARQ
jgi:HEAT repeat protein